MNHGLLARVDQSVETIKLSALNSKMDHIRNTQNLQRTINNQTTSLRDQMTYGSNSITQALYNINMERSNQLSVLKLKH